MEPQIYPSHIFQACFLHLIPKGIAIIDIPDFYMYGVAIIATVRSSGR